LTQLREEQHLRKMRKARNLRFLSRDHSYEEICSYGYKNLLTLTLVEPLCPEDCESLKEEDLLIHLLSSRALESQDAAAASEAANKVSGGVEPSTSAPSHSLLPTTTPTLHRTPAIHLAVPTVQLLPCDAYFLPVQPTPQQVEKSRPPPAPNWLLQLNIDGWFLRPPPAPNWHRWPHHFHHHSPANSIMILCAEETYWVWLLAIFYNLLRCNLCFGIMLDGDYIETMMLLLETILESILFYNLSIDHFGLEIQLSFDEQTYFPWLCLLSFQLLFDR
jgi:hypothetical protein